MEVGKGSYKGITHSKNEDGMLIIRNKDYNIYFVFDGVSSSVNSTQAIDILKEFIRSEHKSYSGGEDYNFRELMYDANQAIVNSGIEDALTTYCALYFSTNIDKQIKFSNLGDSRIYSFTNQFLEKISIDDSIYPGSNILNKCLGMKGLIREDFRNEVFSQESTKFILCTDGFYHFVENNRLEFFKIMNGQNLKTVKSKLKKKIYLKNRDDATYIIVV